ncbi:hypothetical protein PHYSODRAFT_516262 [Phytophthora sojae]|uniref:Uncharacterized protein n=1 Tax=Phytophthora sojae (strain P6497) TaxID=1094619 RepID=G4ZVG5_PHYSP|nr:hypothetical protein PHYSODRAFT_516262 [Phytophthora sojae]EGZ11483.1 hypothetical protein PHYSODRAFT_516262 [Phytophthora sojae]|eukprot:XP_009531816.1 hypothetical protein PHYSODRAFT_516262 [Phytophthora sojae]
MAAAAPHVLLYFDVNKTVIMHDPVQGKTLLHILNDLLTERALGRVVDAPDGDTKWVWDGEKALQTATETRAGTDGLVSYGSFLRAKFPLSGDPQVAKHNKRMRKVLRQDFTAKGNPGEGLASEHGELLQHLLLPDTAATEVQLGQVGLQESPYCFIVPAFFRLMEYLQTNDVKFNLIFRTYGNDLHRVAQEFNCFCEGRHPCFPLEKAMDGSDEGIDRRIHLHQESDGEMPRFGTFLRAESTTALVMGTFKQPKTADDVDPLAFYAPHGEEVQIVQGLSEIHNLLARRWRDSQATLALRDFYPHWFRNKEDATAGKLLVLDPTDDDEGVHAMFFDDNILAHDAHIVDARFAHNDLALSFDTTKELYLLRVEPLDVIQSDTYFIRRFETSMKRWRRKQQS